VSHDGFSMSDGASLARESLAHIAEFSPGINCFLSDIARGNHERLCILSGLTI
jgi:hypothetical protein